MNTSNKDTSITLHCFTPLVTLITFFIEAGIAVITLIKYRKTLFGQLSVALIAALSLFQLSEYLICSGGDPQLWHKIGWVSITLLPVIALGLVDLLVGKSVWTKIGLFFMIIFAVMAAFVPGVTLTATCGGNFVLFSHASLYEAAYATYYLVFLLVGVVRLLTTVIQKRHHPATPYLLAGYASFMLPTFLIFTFVSLSSYAFPSVLCGFAVLFSLIMIAKVLPVYHAGKK